LVGVEIDMVVSLRQSPATPSLWINILVPDIAVTYKRAMEAGCTEIQPLSELPDFGVINALFTDPFGYIWMLHQIVREVSFEERTRILEEKMKINAE